MPTNRRELAPDYRKTRTLARTGAAFRMLMLSDFGPNRPTSLTNDAESAPDPSGHSATSSTELTFDVHNRFSSSDSRLRIRIPVADLSDLTPAGIVAHVPILRAAVDIRHLSLSYLEGRRERTTPFAFPAFESEHDLLAQIVNDISRQSALKESVAKLTTLIDAQINDVLHHPVFLKVESAWRGYRFLLEQTIRGTIQIDTVISQRDDLINSLRERLLNTSPETHAAPSLAVVDFDFTPEDEDVALLQHLAELAQKYQVPVIASAAQTFFGPATSLDVILHTPTRHEKQRPLSAWNMFRAQPSSQWLCLGFNQFALREPYTTENCSSFHFAESPVPEHSLSWGNPAWVVAALVARSVNQTHWPTQITGMQHGQLARLPLRAAPGQQIPDSRITLRSILTMQTAEIIRAAGLAPLLCQSNRDSAYLLQAPTVYRPLKSDVVGYAEPFSFPHQLFISHVTHSLQQNQRIRVAGQNQKVTKLRTLKFLDTLLADTGPNHAASVEVASDPNYDDRRVLQLDVHSGSDILGGATVRMNVPL